MQALNETLVCRANQVLIFKQAERPSQVYVAEGLAQRAYRKSSIVCSCDTGLPQKGEIFNGTFTPPDLVPNAVNLPSQSSLQQLVVNDEV